MSVAAVSNAVQCKYAAAILADLARRRREEDPGIAAGARPALGKETAVVLTDENLLLPLLYALPADIGRVNVTMGFPLRQSLAYTFVERLVELQNHRRRKGGHDCIKHSSSFLRPGISGSAPRRACRSGCFSRWRRGP